MLSSVAMATLSPFISTLNAAEKKVKIGVFSKHLQFLNYQDTSDTVKEIGWDCIECPVRPSGHVLPERVEEDLPRMVEALKKNDLYIAMVTTKINDISEPHAETILRTMAGLGIKTYRIGGWKYDNQKSIPQRLTEIKAQLEDLVALNKELGITAAYQNHSGTNVGAAVWDIYELIRDLDHDRIGIAFDIGHATVEGGYAWVNHFKLMKPHFKNLIIKDFLWEKQDKGNWKAQWVPLGQGMVSEKYYEMLENINYQGEIFQHFEYPVGGRTEKEEQANMLKAMKKELSSLKQLLIEHQVL